ncbi:MarR family winged helix-turn-helix transcriptional regulator [Pimelobacter simplex]|uniref:Transcriptional regulator, MarR family n=1 Tax=Nocardioides simplex TaxID=2045 RepID=A0A0A1DHA2_NOCSI|nr:MarR family transcriptional regulator [Pimelobacter simplex]AIY16741.1 Transcriptional regulator, MarR family [Pimelobacter simplex]MCG8154193.1 MarR family transcriptional regulator [Pimelobacter simplex]GEB15601.1 MarR family transcriptional regulator [Pimelobacter simplex]SFM57763.1 MarR family protein [Pimelobacter simplex]
MSTPDVDALAGDLTVQAARLVRLVRREHAPSAGTRVLSILDELGPLGITALAQVDRCSQPTMTGQVRQLVELGWVTKEPNPADARGSLVALTADGRAELRRIRRLSAALVSERLARRTDLTADDLATAVAVLQAVLEPTSEGTS